MKIYILSVNEVKPTDSFAVYLSYTAPRTMKKLEYFSTREGAEKRQKDIYDGLRKLVGSIDNFEITIKEQEVL